jgi:hypothetical protein
MFGNWLIFVRFSSIFSWPDLSFVIYLNKTCYENLKTQLHLRFDTEIQLNYSAYVYETSQKLMICCSHAAHKEHEMEIGFPTDVKHVAHIGLGTSDTSPSWVRIQITWRPFQIIFLYIRLIMP